MRSKPLISIAVVSFLLLVLAISLQIPIIVDNMAHLLRQSMTPLQSIRGAIPRLKAPSYFHPTSYGYSYKVNRSLSILPQQQHTSQSSPYSTTDMAASKAFFELVEERRTNYQLTNSSTISDARIKELVDHTIKHVPSAFNSQTTRIVLVLKEHHQKLWDSIIEVYRTMLPDEKFQHAKGRMDGFRAAYGTVSTLPPHAKSPHISS